MFLLHARFTMFRASVLGRVRGFLESLRTDRGSTVAEYALVLVLVSLAVIGVLTTLGTTLKAKIQEIIDDLQRANPLGS